MYSENLDLLKFRLKRKLTGSMNFYTLDASVAEVVIDKGEILYSDMKSDS